MMLRCMVESRDQQKKKIHDRKIDFGIDLMKLITGKCMITLYNAPKVKVLQLITTNLLH